MEKDFIDGRMAENMKGNISMTKNMDLALILGLMGESIRGG